MDEILNINYNKYRLENGLDLILYKDNSLPLVSINIWYKVGSANEVEGKTGFAHLFEHMMFQGSRNVPKEMHFKYIEEAGGNLNGSTSIDRTNYYESVPSNYLELVLWLESDRMGYLLDAMTQEKLDNQKDVVMNERRQRYDNQPYGLAWEIIFSNLFQENHPYHWPTIGWMRDIENYKLNDVKDFFNTYYSPNNASLVICGDIDNNKTLELVKKYFEEIPASNSIPKISFKNNSLAENKKIIHEDNVQLAKIYFAWETAKLYDTDDAPLDILAEVLTGSKNGRLTRSLVFEKQIAQDVNCFQYSGNLTGMFFIVATAKPEVALEDLKIEIFNELNKISADNITIQELEKAKNSAAASFIYSLQNLGSLANQLNQYNTYLNEPNSFIYDLNRITCLTENQISAMISKYLNKPYVELHILPRGKN